MKNKKIIIFDMDGVLFDSIGLAQKYFLLRHPGVTEEMYKEMGCGNYYEEAKKYVHLKKEEAEEEKIASSIAYSEKKSKTPMFEGVGNLLKDLHEKGYLLVLSTNAYERNCLPLLECSGTKSLFDFVATAELSKSKIEKFKIIEEKYNTAKEDILFVTDTLGDVREADVAGIPTIAVTWGAHDRSYFNREKHSNLIGIFNTVKELKDFIVKTLVILN